MEKTGRAQLQPEDQPADAQIDHPANAQTDQPADATYEAGQRDPAAATPVGESSGIRRQQVPTTPRGGYEPSAKDRRPASGSHPTNGRRPRVSGPMLVSRGNAATAAVSDETGSAASVPGPDAHVSDAPAPLAPTSSELDSRDIATPDMNGHAMDPETARTVPADSPPSAPTSPSSKSSSPPLAGLAQIATSSEEPRHTGNGHPANGHTGNGHNANGHTSGGASNGHTANGTATNAHLADGIAVDDGPTIVYRPRPIAARPRTESLARRSRRRRRHFTHYLRQTTRARHAARTRLVARLTWAASILLGLLVVTMIASTVAAAASYYQSEQPLLLALNHNVASRDSVRIFDERGTLLYQFNDDGAQHSVALTHIPVVVINATVAIEDHDFWTNQGVDFTAIARAAVTDYSNGQLQEGASTITQQLIKQNVLSSDPTFTRKIKEAILSLGLTSQGVFTKSQIIQMYLNSIPYGPTTYGIDAAATHYFSYVDDPRTGETAAQHLDLAQASVLAGIPQSPLYNDPLGTTADLQHALARQLLVLQSLTDQGYITPAQATAAAAEARGPHFLRPMLDETDLAPHFVEYVRNQLDNMVSTGQLHTLSRSGLNVYTTLDLDMQNHVQTYMIDHLCGYDLNDYPGSPNRYISQDNVTNSSAVMVNQHTGAIVVLLGSVDYYGKKNCHKSDGQFDVATAGFRGPGSSFKPIGYATAFQKGYFPALTISNTPTVFWDAGAGTFYKPLNADTHLFIRDMTLRDALQESLNIPAVKVMQFAGVQDVQRNAMRMGITSWQGTWGLSSILGTLNVHLIDMVQAYSVFANYGQFIPEHAINSITDTAGDVLYQYHQPQPAQVLSPQVAFMISSILSDNPARAPEFGGCSMLYLDPSFNDCVRYHYNSPNAWPAAAKTGTGQDLTDDWAMGYTMDYTMGVWVGNDDYTNMQWVDGVTGAAPIWHNSMLYAERNLPKTPFPVPSGLHRAKYTSNGITTTDWFLNGPLPPANIGNTGPASECITYHPDDLNDPWDYCGMNTEGKGQGG
ncbi:MAG TPA: transglycosylase domain-containing protein [Ktedonobacterales bacterium]